MQVVQARVRGGGPRPGVWLRTALINENQHRMPGLSGTVLTAMVVEHGYALGAPITVVSYTTQNS